MKFSRWAFLFLAASAVLFGQRADASRTPLSDVRASITQPHQLTAATATSDQPADVPNQVRDASTCIVESIIPLGTTADGQPLALISLLVPLSSLDELPPTSTRAGPFAAPETHTRVFCIVQPPLGLESQNVIELNMPEVSAYSHPYAFGGDWDDASDFRALELGPVEGLLKGTAEGMMGAAALPGTYVHVTAAAKGAEYAENSMYLDSSWHGTVATFNPIADGDRHLMGDVAKLCVWWNVEVMTRALLGWGGQSVMRVNGFWRIRFFDLTGYRHSGARPAGGFGRCDDLVDEWALANADWR